MGIRKLRKVSNIQQHSLPASCEIYASQCVDEAESSMPDVLGYWFVSKAGIPFLTPFHFNSDENLWEKPWGPECHGVFRGISAGRGGRAPEATV